jgi:hypothetical protein
MGATGWAYGAHIHFMVIQDKDGDGDFDDDYPWGLTDPFKWFGEGEDPWASFSWNGNTGNTSRYLWIGDIYGFTGTLTRSELNRVQTERFTYVFPEDTFSQDVQVEERGGPVVRVTDNLVSIGSISILTVRDFLGNIISFLLRPFTLIIDFSGFDLSRYNVGSISIYSSEDGVNWSREETSVDLDNRQASAQISHLSYFALMAERLDIIPPITNASLEGESGEVGWFRSDVLFALTANDNVGGLGVDYTLYRVNDGDWRGYQTPELFSEEGDYRIEFYSVDKDENIEGVKAIEFAIDKKVPEARLFYDVQQKQITGEGIDDNETTVSKQPGVGIEVTDLAGNTLSISGTLIESELQDSFETLSLAYVDGLVVGPLNRKLLIIDNLDDSNEDNRYLLQRWYVDYFPRIEITYKPTTNKSSILLKELGLPVQKEKRDGLVLLQVVTSRGNLEIEY